MSHPKDYAHLRSGLLNESPNPSESLLTPGQKKRYQFTTSPRRDNRYYVIACFALFLSLGFNIVWLLGLISGAHETCHVTQDTRLVMKDSFANVHKKDNKAWTDLQGGSWGTVYTKENRDDGVVRMGGVAMLVPTDYFVLHIPSSMLQKRSGIANDHTGSTNSTASTPSATPSKSSKTESKSASTTPRTPPRTKATGRIVSIISARYCSARRTIRLRRRSSRTQVIGSSAGMVRSGNVAMRIYCMMLRLVGSGVARVHDGI